MTPPLDRLVELAYQQNLPLQIAGLRIVEARAQLAWRPASSGRRRKRCSARATANRPQPQRGRLRRAGRYSAQLRQLSRSGFDAAWELDFWGKYRRGVEAEAANLLASVADYYSALVSLTAEVARTYVAIRTFEVLIEQARGRTRASRRRR